MYVCIYIYIHNHIHMYEYIYCDPASGHIVLTILASMETTSRSFCDRHQSGSGVKGGGGGEGGA